MIIIQPQLTLKNYAACLLINTPGVTFYVLPVDIVTQILNFGLSAPIDLQIIGRNLNANRELGEKMLSEVKQVTGAQRYAHSATLQILCRQMTVNVDDLRTRGTRVRAEGCFRRGTSYLSGRSQTAPSFYLDPKTGVSYSVAVQAQQYNVDSLDALRSIR